MRGYPKFIAIYVYLYIYIYDIICRLNYDQLQEFGDIRSIFLPIAVPCVICRWPFPTIDLAKLDLRKPDRRTSLGPLGNHRIKHGKGKTWKNHINVHLKSFKCGNYHSRSLYMGVFHSHLPGGCSL